MPKPTIKQNYTAKDIKSVIMKELEKVKTVVVNRFIRVGEAFVTNARNNGTYKDVTSNLRSSIYYRVYAHGKMVFDGTGAVKRTPEGEAAAKALIEKIEAQILAKYGFDSIILVCVAGMHYALYVEAMGRDVITGSSFIAKKQLQTALKEISKKR